ncbi:MAG TPA: Zn-dependent hydrolase [Candidatus Avacidaminococcus intestinavium]|uniref:Zn-dependent hydrolase n=1 Tax=Candidatus Avacidaminococcus intestinavium TaxID=2840684 RepID=A0A9D1MQP1_9FIRM|nr:Zn-dependent hydrolase [Candidatus Avacidaminococcus intestinavium]
MLRPNKERVNSLIAGIAEFGKTASGNTRLAYSAEDNAAIQWLLKQVEDLGLQISEDTVGNVFLRRPGYDSAAKPIAMGSHLDTVAHGGAYDGIVGVISALETMYMLRNEQLKHTLETIIFRAEESTRFGFATIGSKLMTGSGTPQQFSSAAKQNDKTFEECLRENGYDPTRYKEAIKKQDCYKCFLEVHIEQGKVLDETGDAIGIVQNIAAPTRFKLIIEGLADHSGATPMGFRKDALVAGAKLILAIEQAAVLEATQGTVATVGVVDIEPSSINVIPGQVVLWVDVRGVDETSIALVLSEIAKSCQQVENADNMKIQREMLTQDHPVPLNDEITKLLLEICHKQGIKARVMNSGAGHDAMHMAKLVPTGMIFIPCRKGISHNPAEYVSIEEIITGIEVLAEAIYRLAK